MVSWVVWMLHRPAGLAQTTVTPLGGRGRAALMRISGNAVEIVPIMVEFKEVETCVECSAKIPLNVSEVSHVLRAF